MKLTRFQYKVLKIWQRSHTAGYGIGQWVRTCWKQWLILAVLGAWAFYYLVPFSHALGCGYLGIIAGIFLRDVSYYQGTRRCWPVTNQVMDWKQVQELVETHEKNTAKQPPQPS